jgi:hypothetical protein
MPSRAPIRSLGGSKQPVLDALSSAYISAHIGSKAVM